jgi:hypothetical protein
MKRVLSYLVALAVSAPVLAEQAPQQTPVDVPWNDAIPAGTAEHAARALKESPRHGEWVDIKMADGTALKSWVVYPERSTKAGVVLVIHDIRGMSDTARAVGDQLAQDGFSAIVPDFLSGKGPNGGGTESLGAGVGAAIQGLTDVNARLNAAMAYGKTLPASNGKTGVVGFCWGGARSFGCGHWPEWRRLSSTVSAGFGRGRRVGGCGGCAAGQRQAPVILLQRQRRADPNTVPVTQAVKKPRPRDAHLRGRRPRLHEQQAGSGGAT